MNNKYFKYLSAPWWAYIGAVVLSVLLYFLSTSIQNVCHWVSQLCLNLGHGIIASLIVSLFIDLGNTNRKHKTEQAVLSRMLADLKNECAELPSEMIIAVYEAVGYDFDKKTTFSEWTDILFEKKDNSISEPQTKEILYVLQTVEDIRRKALEVLELMRYSLDNTAITDDLMKRTKQLISVCNRICREQKRPDYEVCKKLITEDLTVQIKEMFPDLKKDYTRSYNEKDYSDE